MRLFEGTPFDIPPKCDHCGLLESECKCTPEQKARVAPQQQLAHVRVEKRKNGKVVTVVRGLEAKKNDFQQLVKALRVVCGAGGSIDGDTIEIQGNHIPRVEAELKRIGYKVKIDGR